MICIVFIILAVVGLVLWHKKRGKNKMPVGLQIYNASGKLILDYTERGVQIYGTKKITGGKNATGTISDSRIKAGETFIVPYNITLDAKTVSGASEEYYAMFMGIQPEFTIVDGKITWRYGTAPQSLGAYVGMSILYGGGLS